MNWVRLKYSRIEYSVRNKKQIMHVTHLLQLFPWMQNIQNHQAVKMNLFVYFGSKKQKSCDLFVDVIVDIRISNILF